ncbi:tetraspanin-3-like [Arapaima gigas]
MCEVVRISKIILLITCQLFWFAALLVALTAVYLRHNYQRTGLLLYSAGIILPGIVALVSVAFLLSATAVGCSVFSRRSAGLQALVESQFEPFWNMFQNYTGHSQDPDSNPVDAIQEELQCCGVCNYTDWLNTPWFNQTGRLQVPHSCCNSVFLNCSGALDHPELLYLQGCRMKLEDGWIFLLRLIIFSSVAIAVVQIFGLVSVAQLMRSSNRSKENTGVKEKQIRDL